MLIPDVLIANNQFSGFATNANGKVTFEIMSHATKISLFQKITLYNIQRLEDMRI